MQVISMSGLLAAAIFAGLAEAAIRPSTKTASGYCQKITETNSLELRFSIKLGTDPEGTLMDMNPPTSSPRGKIWSENLGTCSFVYTEGTTVPVRTYTVTSIVDLSGVASHVNPCGVQVDAVLGTYTWYFLQRLEEDGFSEGFVDLDRIYTVECNATNIHENVIEATIGLTTPYLEQPLDTSDMTVRMYVEKYDEGNSVFMTVTEAAVGETLRVVLEMDIENPYTARLHPYGIYGYHTVLGSSDAFTENDLLINDDGCANNNAASRPPFITNKGWKWFAINNPSTSGIWKLVTGEFFAYKYGTITSLYIRTSWKPCFEPKLTLDMCVDLCLATAGVTGRRKRQAEERTKRLVTVINIVDNRSPPQSSHSAATSTVVIAVSCVISLLAVVFVVILVAVFFNRRRNAPERRVENGPHYFENPPPVYEEKQGVKY